MALGRYQNAQLQTALGQAVAGAEVFFLTQPASPSTLTPLASVFTDSTGDTAVVQPLITDGFGEFAAYLAPGVYTVVYVSPFIGMLVYPDQNIAVGGGTPGTVTFDEIGSGNNTTAIMGVASGSVLGPSGTGIIQATQIGTQGNGVVVSGVPGIGQVLTALSPTEASWATPGGSTAGVTSLSALTGAVTLAAGAGISLSIVGNTITISLGVTFSITSFTGGSTVEIGTSITNPTFNATYSATPANANITNTEGIDSPQALTSPFTSGTIIGTFVHTAIETTTFTLSATNGTTQTATQSIAWEPRIFSGVGTSGGATGATASGTSAVLIGTTGTLPSAGLGVETVGKTFVFNLTGNFFYMLLVNSGHTFNVNGLPATLASTPVTFVNAVGVTIAMNLYVGPTFGTGTFTVVIES
jgi:hypothetical protein